MRRKTILKIILIILLIYISPIGGMLYFTHGKILYDAKKYEQSVSWFERSMKNSPRNKTSRYYYVLALSKLKPTYSVQEKIYKMSVSPLEDEAQKMARTQVLQLRQRLLENLENNYIYNAPATQGVLRWNIKSFPLKVYIENNSQIPSYFYDKIKQAFSLWEDNTNFIKFKFTDNKLGANIFVYFNPDYKADCPENKNCIYQIAKTEPDITTAGELKNMTITFNTKNPRGTAYNKNEVYQTAIHEIGHALGIMGHSDDTRDVMFGSNENIGELNHLGGDFLTERDLKTMILLYRLKPIICNTRDLFSETFYYAPLIIGSDEEVLKKKYKEWRLYIDNYPEMVSGYINMASVLIQWEKYDDALKYLDRAEKRAQNSDDNYLIEFQRANVYFNKKDKVKALEYAKKAQKQKSTEEIEKFIHEISNVK